MRTLLLAILLGVLAAPAFAADDFQWADGGQVLALHGDGERVVVTAAAPAPLHGLQAGDVVVAVGGHAVHATSALMQALRAAGGHPVTVQVARAGVVRSLRWTAADYRAFLPPPPPPPPAPPAAPAPPAPPPPPAPGN